MSTSANGLRFDLCLLLDLETGELAERALSVLDRRLLDACETCCKLGGLRFCDRLCFV